ncbi:glycosyltransferase [Tamlana sp. 2_MG-2023]|uniref:glycosyltransferase family 2 protein n=1 Tax=unclassified Tamlana TaxID=2614803 RepID=UPI0026E1FDF1|nr:MULTISPECIES: glycosyltransferase [unclassified Tamlana]MDO6758753.1 glycosyltransferase [Tamlana sp. 2_MG-2023]MDO6789452.1 glycosyltransferase [Tamlana sp. 1_MG-2023]
MNLPDFSILITTKNRLPDLKETLKGLADFIENRYVEFIICDDGSSDGTSEFIKSNYKSIHLIKNKKSKGLIFSRNRLLNLTRAKYAITLDDDAHIVSKNSLQKIKSVFESNKKCAVIAFRIFWGEILPDNVSHKLVNKRVKGFVGCGHVWRMAAWRSIPNYPDWFVFYGEEEFASFQLFKNNWEVWFVPDVLVHHRVNVKARKKQKDYTVRLRRSLRSGWYLYILFYPLQEIPRKLVYTLWMQLKLKVFKGDFKALLAVLQALGDVLVNMLQLTKSVNRLTQNEYKLYQNIAQTKIYWKS